MAKISNEYLEVHPYKIIEKGFHKDRALVSESLFSLGNEYSGVRGFFDEDYSDKQLIGTYYNGIYEYSLEDTPSAYKSIVKRTHFTINSLNWLRVQIKVGDEVLDLNKSKFADFYRELDLTNGVYLRSFVWNTKLANITISFERILSMNNCEIGAQRIKFKSDNDVDLSIKFIMDGNVLHWSSHCYRDSVSEKIENNTATVKIKTPRTEQTLSSSMYIDSPVESYKTTKYPGFAAISYKINLKTDKQETFTRYCLNLIDKNNDFARAHSQNRCKTPLFFENVKNNVIEFDSIIEDNARYFANVYEKSDIIIEGDDKNQQGIRYCIFQLEQTYHGYEGDNNIGAKGLTGEAYSGHAFWDSETYCLPYYLFTNKEAAKKLLMFRYSTLNQARARAKDLDCDGACFPVATRNGEEACNLWQHASLQFQPSTAVSYAIQHYMNLYKDKEFMQNYGIELLLEISKFLYSRGDYSSDGKTFGFYSVMGPDEFQMMVNHNTYTNYMAKRAFEYTLEVLADSSYKTEEILKKVNVNNELLEKFKDAAEKMLILYDPESKVFEQHDGFFKLPHIDINKIPVEDFPLYHHWAYDRIYINDMIKQPDVLMFMFLYNSSFTNEQLKANYEYYEPRCIHESSLSPSVHSILANQIGKFEEAYNFFGFATRLDLDDYNRNTCEGIHTTSIAAAWVNIVYGFGGLRSDGAILSIAPTIPEKWASYSFKISLDDIKLNIKVTKDKLFITNKGDKCTLKIYNKIVEIDKDMVIER